MREFLFWNLLVSRWHQDEFDIRKTLMPPFSNCTQVCQQTFAYVEVVLEAQRRGKQRGVLDKHKAHTWHPATRAPSHPPHHTWRRVALLHLPGEAEVPQDVEMGSHGAICRQHVEKTRGGVVAAGGRWVLGG
jgi:hypothetical protein